MGYCPVYGCSKSPPERRVLTRKAHRSIARFAMVRLGFWTNGKFSYRLLQAIGQLSGWGLSLSDGSWAMMSSVLIETVTTRSTSSTM